MKIQTFHDLLVMLLKDTYSAENQLVEALPKMAKAATDPDLKAGFENHLEQTQEHVKRLERIAEMLEIETLGGLKCHGMEGLVFEGAEVIKETETPEVLDAGLIHAAQKVEHYEIVAYATLIAWVKEMGHDDVVEILGQTLDEEKETDEILNIAAEKLNAVANEVAED